MSHDFVLFSLKIIPLFNILSCYVCIPQHQHRTKSCLQTFINEKNLGGSLLLEDVPPPHESPSEKAPQTRIQG